jgi:hypothetical protein
VPSRPALQRRPLLETYDSIIIREGAPSFMPSRQDPQVSSIAPGQAEATAYHQLIASMQADVSAL